jgi:hypothetical protein
MACYAVASALVLAASVIEDAPHWPGRVRRLGLDGIAAVFGVRGVLGLAGMTATVSPGSASVRFQRLDRRLYAPLCLALAGGTVLARRREADRSSG